VRHQNTTQKLQSIRKALGAGHYSKISVVVREEDTAESLNRLMDAVRFMGREGLCGRTSISIAKGMHVTFYCDVDTCAWGLAVNGGHRDAKLVDVLSFLEVLGSYNHT
jgi:hypothetical protein